MHEPTASACEALPQVREVRLHVRPPLPLGRELYRGEEQKVLRRLPMVLDTASRNDGGLVHTRGGGEQAEVVRIFDYCAGGSLHAIRAEPDHLPLVHTEQEHHHLGMPVVAQSQLPAELATKVGITV